MLVLIAEDDSSHNLLLTRLVRRDCKLDVISCFSIVGARAVIESSPGVYAIICASELADGKALEIFEMIRRRHVAIPFILYATDVPNLDEFRADFFLGLVHKNNPQEVCKLILGINATIPHQQS